MRATKTIAQPDLNLVTSQSFQTAARFKRRSASACVMSVPQSDLTLDMAELYLANLQRDLPFADLGSDGCRIWLGDQTTVSLKMLRRELSELFRLAGQQAPQPPAQRSAILQDGAPEAVLGACAKLNLTGKHDAGELTNWVSGVLAASERDQGRRIQTPGALSALIHALDPLGLPMMAVVWLMQKGWQINPELVNERTRWTVGQVLSLMVTLRCDGLVLSRHIRRAYRTSSRPSVVAARLSLLRCDEAVEASHDTEHLKGVLQRLEAHAPKMLRSVSRRNGFLANPSPERSSSFQRLPEWLPPGLQDNLFLPRCGMTSSKVCPVNTEAHAIIFGACLTLLKAVSAYEFRRDLDMLVDNFVFARNICDGFFPSETRAEMARGETLAVSALHRHMLGGFGPSSVAFVAFDGDTISLTRRDREARVGVSRAGMSMLPL